MFAHVLMALALLACVASPAANDDKAAIAALVEEVQAANNAGDVDRWVALFAKDFVYMPSGSPAVTTREGLIEAAKSGFRNRASIDIEPVEIHVSGDWAFARNKVTGTVRLHDSGKEIPIDLKQIAIYRRSAGGAWRIARLISNSNTP